MFIKSSSLFCPLLLLFRRRRTRCRLNSRSNFYNPHYNHMTNEVMIEPRITRAWITHSTPVSQAYHYVMHSGIEISGLKELAFYVQIGNTELFFLPTKCFKACLHYL